MAFQKPKVQPTFADLKAILSQTQLDNTSYQLLQTLIERLVQYQAAITEELAKKGTGGGTVGPQGPQGPPGTPGGPPGPMGPMGPPGATGETGPEGPKGDKGDTGPIGPTGPMGPQGPEGEDGTGLIILGEVPSSGNLPPTGNTVGDAWITGDDGHLWTWDGTQWIDVGPVQGPPGETGPMGPAGPQGPQGIQGIQGPVGSTGQTGETGAQGPQGEKGDTGEKGDPGNPLEDHQFMHQFGGDDELINNAWTDRANIFTIEQNIQVSGGPQLKFLDTSQLVDQRLWRIQNIGTQLNILATNDAVTANSAIFVFHRDGKLTIPGNFTAGNNTLPTTLSLHADVGGAKINFYSAGIYDSRIIGYNRGMYYDANLHTFRNGDGTAALAILNGNGLLSAYILQPSSGYIYNTAGTGAFYLAGGTQIQSFSDTWYWTNSANTGHRMLLDSNSNLTVYGSITTNGILCTTINTQLYGITAGPISASGRVVLTGGVTGAYNVGPLEVAMTGNPRISFHWPGQVASQLGMDINGVIRTFDNPGTGYAAFACGALSIWGVCNAGNISCTNINTNGYDVTTGTLTATTARIGAVGFNTGGYPALRAAANAHLVINAAPLYLNLDVPGNSVLCYGPFTMSRFDIMSTAHIYPIAGGTWTLGHTGAKFGTAFFNLQPAPAGAAYVQTDATGALVYLPSDRKFKKNIRPVDAVRSKKILTLEPQYYQHLQSEEGKDVLLGLMTDEIPDELEDLVTRFTRTSDNGPELIESIHYERVSLHLLVVMKDQQRRIDALEARLGI